MSPGQPSNLLETQARVALEGSLGNDWERVMGVEWEFVSGPEASQVERASRDSCCSRSVDDELAHDNSK
jgi:hypothetical protein